MRKIYLLLSIGMIFILAGCTDSTENKTNKQPIQENTQKQEEATEKEQIDNIYPDDEAINLLINKYNKNNEDKITSDMLTKKHIGGRDRDDVVVISNDKLEIILYNDYSLNNEYKMSVYVGYTNTNETIDDYKKQFITYVKLFDESLTNDEIDNYWNDLISTYHSTYEINDIDIVCHTNDGTITYFKLSSKIKF